MRPFDCSLQFMERGSTAVTGKMPHGTVRGPVQWRRRRMPPMTIPAAAATPSIFHGLSRT